MVAHHLSSSEPNVDAEIVGAVPPTSQKTADSCADGLELSGGDNKHNNTEEQNGWRE